MVGVICVLLLVWLVALNDVVGLCCSMLVLLGLLFAIWWVCFVSYAEVLVCVL